MNKIAKGFVQDPNYDMTIPSDSDEDSENYLDAGAFGQVFLERTTETLSRKDRLVLGNWKHFTNERQPQLPNSHQRQV